MIRKDQHQIRHILLQKLTRWFQLQYQLVMVALICLKNSFLKLSTTLVENTHQKKTNFWQVIEPKILHHWGILKGLIKKLQIFNHQNRHLGHRWAHKNQKLHLRNKFCISQINHRHLEIKSKDKLVLEGKKGSSILFSNIRRVYLGLRNILLKGPHQDQKVVRENEK